MTVRARTRVFSLLYSLSLNSLRVDQILLHANPSESERIYAREFVSLKKTRRERERERERPQQKKKIPIRMNGSKRRKTYQQERGDVFHLKV